MNRFNNKAHTLTEIILACAITVILLTSVQGAFVLTKQIYASSIARANLQRDADITLKKMIKGECESTGIFRLSDAKKFRIVNINKLEFWGADNDVSSAATRWYCLNGSGTSILYHHPRAIGAQDEIIYTVPSGAALTLQFRPHAVILPPNGPGDVYTNIDTCINVAISQNLYGKNISGSATAMVNIRNHP